MRAAPVLFASFAVFAVIEGAVFHTGVYPWVLNPDASTGYVETRLRDERERPKDGPQVLGIGDSRMLLLPRVANESTAETGYTFGSIAAPGASTRSWYYMLRTADPEARLYRAVLMAVESYDDTDKWGDEADNDADLSYVIPDLRLADLWEYSRSFDDPWQRWKAFRGILFKGLVYKRDFEDLLRDPVSRVRYVVRSRRDSFGWQYGYHGPTEDLSGFQVDFQTKTLIAPPNAKPALVDALKDRLFSPLPPATGMQSRYMKYWLGKIYNHYRNSQTRLIFLRLPRGGFVRPDQPPYNPHGSVRDLAAHPNVALIDEHFFDVLERPEFFQDQLHLNGPGMDRFSAMIVQEAGRILGPPR